jgi:hypothetical protein
MTQRTRYFFVGSVLVLVVGLCTGLVATYGGSLPFGSASAGPTELTYLPASTVAVGYANVHEIMNSEFRQKLRQVIPTGEAKDKLQAELGLDIEHDIDTVIAGMTNADGMGGAVVLVRGRFNESQIEAMAVQHGAKVEDYKGTKVILSNDLPNTSEGKTVSGEGAAAVVQANTGGMAFLEPGLIALGDSAAIKAAIDTKASHQDVTTNPELMKLVATAGGPNNVWAVGRFDAVSKSTVLPQEIKDHLPAVEWVMIEAHVNGGVSGSVRVEARDDEAAKNLRDVVTGGLAAAHLVAGKDSKIDALVDSLQVSGTGKTVALAFTVPAEIFDIINGVAGLKNLGGKPPEKTPGKPIAK